MSRIQGSLTIAPSAPKVVAAAGTADMSSAAGVEKGEDVPGQVEMPFVPASERQEMKRTNVEQEQDSIVVVGQSQRKKRKRVAAIKVEKEGEAALEETFDYSAVSNILDEGSDHEPEGRKRRQKTQGVFYRTVLVVPHLTLSGRFDYGNFRAPPKAHSEVKSGNQSRTFK